MSENAKQERQRLLPLAQVDLEKVRRRMMKVVLEGDDRTAVQAARVLLKDDKEGSEEGTIQLDTVGDIYATIRAMRANGAAPSQRKVED